MSRPDRDSREMRDGAPAGSRRRLDKWLWFARVAKSRTLAAKLVTDGHVRVNSVRVETPAKAVGPGDVLTIALERQVRVLKVVDGGERRGPFAEARLLYEDLTPPAPALARSLQPARAPGAGRPTKRERRSLAAWLGRL